MKRLSWYSKGFAEIPALSEIKQPFPIWEGLFFCWINRLSGGG